MSLNKILIVGGGSIGKRHLENLLNLGEKDIVVVEPNLRRAQIEIEKKYNVKTFKSLEDVFEDNEFNIAFICSPSIFHLDNALFCAKKDCDLFIEKPLSNKIEGTEELLKEIENRNLVCMLGSNWKFHPHFKKMKELLDSGSIGKVLSARCQFGSYLPDWHPWENHLEGYSANKKLGGGVLLESHEFDYTTWFLGGVEKMACFADKIGSVTTDTEDTAEIILKFKSGAIGEIHLDYTQRFYRRNFEFFGEKGTILWNAEKNNVEVFIKGIGKEIFSVEENYSINNMYLDEIKHFLKCVKDRTETITPIKKAIEILKLICSAKEASEHDKVVNFNDSYMESKKTEKTLELWNKAKKILPGGSQLLSKRAEMFLPNQWPAYYKEAKGIEVEDLDGNKYLDMTYMGLGSCILGYADEDVNKAVIESISNGSMTTLNCEEEVELAELMLKLHSWAGMVRYARTGGEALTVAVRIARAYSKKEKVAFCGYHGWHDWYISTNLAEDKNLDGHLIPGLDPNGISRGLRETSIPFEYNKIEQLEDIIVKHDIGVIVMEVVRHNEPEDNFLQKVREIANKIGAVLVFDEVTSGFRRCIGGVHKIYNVEPDIAVFAKGISNGFPMAIVIGKDNVMDASQTTFISSTYWTERVGPVAALATIKKMQEMNVPAHLENIGMMIWKGWEELSSKHNVRIKIQGPPALVMFSFDYDNAQEVRTLFTQEMLKRGILATSAVYVSYAHKEEHVRKYLETMDEVFGILKKAIDNKNVLDLLEGPVAHSGFKRLT
jgi:glutamate-1-semialdehyde aminotransferase/predicted dehydrogenase